MAVDVALLRRLHHLHQLRQELEGRRDRGPKQVAAHEANVTRLDTALHEAEGSATQTRVNIDQKQLDLKTSETRIADWKVKLNAASSNKEYQGLLDQIAAAEMANSVLEDEILEGLDKIEQLDGCVREAKQTLDAARKELDKVRAHVTSDAVTIQADIERYQAQLAAAEASLPADLRGDYERVIRAKGADGLAAVEDCVCVGCGQQLTLNMVLHEMKQGQVKFCKACGRLLYLAAGE